jgi:hypothetical protein
MGARADRLNRFLLTLLGLLLLTAGIVGLLFGFGAFGERRARERVLDPDVTDFVVRNADWFWPAVALACLLLALLALRWLFQQLRTDRIGSLDLTRDRARGETSIATGAVTDALVDQVERLPGVESANARLVRLSGRRQLLLHVRLADRADARAVRRSLAEGPLTELRQVLGGAAWPAVCVELEPSTKGQSRAVA